MKKCPRCQKGNLVLRVNSKDKREFLGCTGWRDGCRYTENIGNGNGNGNGNVFVPSEEQKDIINDFLEHPGNILVNAGAGTGKSTTALECTNAYRKRHPNARIIYTCFNKPIAVEFAKIAPIGVNVSTMHSLGYGILANTFRIKFDQDKTFYVIDRIAENNTNLHALISHRETGVMTKTSLAKLVSQVKNQLADPENEETVKAIADRFNIDTRDDAIIPWIAPIIEASKTFEVAGQIIIDYDDMVWMPIALGLKFPSADKVVIDECQDLNPCRQHFALLLGKDGTITAIGDRFQSIYGFSGADTAGMDTLERLLGNPSLRSLSFTRRCPASHVRHVNDHYPEIPFHAFPGTPEGSIIDLDSAKLIETVQPNDLIMCRVNAPLISLFFKLIKAKIRAIIIGKKEDVEMLISAIKGLRAKSIPDLLTKIEKARAKELSRAEANAKGRNVKPNIHVIESINDKYDILREIAGACKGMSDVEPTIRSMFGDNGETKDRVRLSSVHRAKGLEAHRTFIIHPELMPHPKAETSEEIEQERNIWYVAHTRAKVLADNSNTGIMHIVH